MRGYGVNCPCGKSFESDSPYVTVLYDYTGQTIIYAVCRHGKVVIDDRPTLKEEND